MNGNEDLLKIKLKRSSRDMEKEGIRHLYFMNQMDEETMKDDDSYLQKVEDVIEVMATELTPAECKTPEVEEAKIKELNNFLHYQAYEKWRMLDSIKSKQDG